MHSRVLNNGWSNAGSSSREGSVSAQVPQRTCTTSWALASVPQTAPERVVGWEGSGYCEGATLSPKCPGTELNWAAAQLATDPDSRPVRTLTTSTLLLMRWRCVLLWASEPHVSAHSNKKKKETKHCGLSWAESALWWTHRTFFTTEHRQANTHTRPIPANKHLSRLPEMLKEILSAQRHEKGNREWSTEHKSFA